MVSNWTLVSFLIGLCQYEHWADLIIGTIVAHSSACEKAWISAFVFLLKILPAFHNQPCLCSYSSELQPCACSCPMLRWNAVIDSWCRCTLPIFVLDDYILLSFSCTVHKPTIFWPNSCISYVLTYILFFFCSPIPYFFLLHCCFPSPFHPFPCVFTFPLLVFPNTHSLPCLTLYFPGPGLHPCLHSLFMLLCLNKRPRTNLPQLTALNHDHDHSPFCGTTLRMDDLFISALPRLSSLLVLRCLLFSLLRWLRPKVCLPSSVCYC